MDTPQTDKTHGFGPYAWPPADKQRSELLALACNGFADAAPTRSARRNFSTMQVILFAALLAGLGLAFMLAPQPTTIAFIFTLWGAAWIAILLRYAPILLAIARKPKNAAVNYLKTEDLPIYSVLVPLLGEVEILPRLVKHLKAIDYPPEKLDIMLLIEEPDAPLRAALENLTLPEFFRIILVPNAAPQTKPKACNYGLLFARGDYITIYDAEDVPHPQQLQAAATRFADAPAELICLQAPLDFETKNGNWLSLHAALEYFMQFHFFLPFCARWRIPILLGGTSNHFRIDVLRSVKGWDAWNVTEDAELGLRLVNYGYRAEMLSLPTRELPCRNWRDWHRQRGRWIKGWLQTYFALMRRTKNTAPKTSLKVFFAAQILILCQMAALLSFPLFFICLILYALSPVLPEENQIVALLELNLLYGAGISLMIIMCHLLALWRGAVPFRLTLMLSAPLYWLLSFPALLRAIKQLCTQPHRWDKTPHPPEPSA